MDLQNNFSIEYTSSQVPCGFEMTLPGISKMLLAIIMFCLIVSSCKNNDFEFIDEREVLISIYNANPQNTLDWNFQKPISSWQGVVVKNNRVVELHMNSAELDTIPPIIGQLKRLQILSVFSNNIKSLPSELGELIYLTNLYLFDNKINTTPKEIFLNLTDIKEISLSSNNLTGIPSDLLEIRGLTSLDIANNNIIEVPKEISNLEMLEYLNLRSNFFSKLPVELSKLESLKRLDIQNNTFLIEIPQEICNLIEIQGTTIIMDNKVLCV